ncbi:hypothetical protein AB7714_18395 [Tardiphaga sp. 1201_B9_N1_1]|jgi:hypothetical protein|uniref:hypothetical protein n=1 Tax=unclassified Tardiphaga TaxID=2631404 RepID=UPI0008A7F196|nr:MULTISPECIES: hypothetical protein [unclassified Tardiphaga]WNV07150.1 hypothetical protein RSO67_16460 [Tardiphaga sp. 709]WPO42041.1 hypothetical protein SFY93_02385 [Tardiphaga sp. 42S5]SEH75839.1 hypothetical protein SAMN05216367_1773 [Tardiphaga sp. OK245]SNS54325.1 hypothetical protein SAMN05216374_1756 [Tardiphaga sp. OK246]
MMKLLITGIWACLVTVGTSFGISYWKETAAALPAKQDQPEGLVYEKVKVINVPMIADGSVQGYIVTQLVFTANAKVLRQLPVPPEPFVVDEAFRMIYGDQKLDFKNLGRYDLTQFAQTVRAQVNKRLQTEALQEVLVQDFNYVSKDQIRR